MDPIVVGVLGMVLMVVLLFVGLPLPIVFFGIGFAGMFILKGWGPAMGLVKQIPFTAVANFDFTVIPLFILLGLLLFEGGLGQEMFKAIQRWLGHFSAGMAAATSGACAFLGCITGNSAAATILVSKIAYPEMKKLNYDPAFSLAVCAASGPVAVLIPPSTNLVIYAIIAEQSVTQTLLAGFIPGFISMGVFMAMILVRGRFDRSLGPPTQPALWRDRFLGLRYLSPALIMMAVIIGGLFLGIFTATEAGGVATMVAFFIILAMRRFTWARFKSALYETFRLSVMVVLIIVTIRGFYNLFLNITWVTQTIAQFAMSMPSPWIVLAAMYAICFILGMFVGNPLALIIIPLFTPVVEQLGFSPIWFIITIVVMTENGWITPPVAPGIFIAQSVIGDVPMEKAFRAVWWFVLFQLFTLGIFIAVPQLVTFLPDMMK